MPRHHMCVPMGPGEGHGLGGELEMEGDGKVTGGKRSGREEGGDLFKGEKTKKSIKDRNLSLYQTWVC